MGSEAFELNLEAATVPSNVVACVKKHGLAVLPRFADQDDLRGLRRVAETYLEKADTGYSFGRCARIYPDSSSL